MSELDFFRGLAGFAPKQMEACDVAHRVRHVLYGGAMGGGKSYWLRWILLGMVIELWRQFGVRGAETMLCCETYPALRDRQLAKIEMEFPRWLGRFRSSAREFRLWPKYGGGAIVFRNLADPSQYQSAEFPIIGIDESTKNAPSVTDYLGTRLRWPKVPTWACHLLRATNPGGIGHADHKRLFIDRKFREGENPRHYAYVRALAQDNPRLDADYLRMLSGLPPVLREAFANGNWDIFVGQVFSEWDMDLHTIEPFRIPRQWPRFRAIDYGYYPGYSAVGWFAEDPERHWLYCYRELYEQWLTPADLAEAIKERTQPEERISYTVADPSLWARNAQTGQTSAEVMEAHGVPLEPANNDRVEGWRRLHQYFKVIDAPWPDYLPLPGDADAKATVIAQARLRFARNCTECARTIPTLSYEDMGRAAERNVEDAKKGGEDHLADMVRYAVMSRPAHELVEIDPDWRKAAEDDEWYRREFGAAERERNSRRSRGW